MTHAVTKGAFEMRTENGPAHVRGWIEVSESGAALVLRIGGELEPGTVLCVEGASSAQAPR